MGTRHFTHSGSASRSSRPANPALRVVAAFGRRRAGSRRARLGAVGRLGAVARLAAAGRVGRRARVGRRVLAGVGAAALLAGLVPASVTASSGTAASSVTGGFDVSWPNCGREFPAGTVLAVVGVTGGKPFTQNPCLRAQYLAARRHGVVRFYLNINKPRGAASLTGPLGRCATANWSCRGFNYGWHAAESAWRYAVGQVGTSAVRTRWWLDVEMTNSWTSSTTVNARVIAGALAYLASRGHADRAGVYSTAYQWQRIAGAYRPGVAVWYATVASSARAAGAFCRPRYGFTGGPVKMVQYRPVGIDRDYLCP
jgi:hypothetical protein